MKTPAAKSDALGERPRLLLAKTDAGSQRFIFVSASFVPMQWNPSATTSPQGTEAMPLTRNDPVNERVTAAIGIIKPPIRPPNR